MERSEDLWTRAHHHAHGFLRRFSDAWTRSHRDDLVQESALAAWQWAKGSHDPARFWAAVRTIARRIRCRALGNVERRLEAQQAGTEQRVEERDDDREYWISGRRVSLQWVRPCLQRALERLPLLDRHLLLGFHEGFCCAELSIRFRRSPACVKTRIHRARRAVQKEIEASVRAADDLDVS